MTNLDVSIYLIFYPKGISKGIFFSKFSIKCYGFLFTHYCST